MSWYLRKAGEAFAHVLVDEVVGKQRPRSSTRNGVTRTYTPRKTKDAEQVIRDQWLAQVGTKWERFEGPVAVHVECYRQLSQSNPKYWAGRCDLSKPDADNVLKTILDALNGTAWADDAQIVDVRFQKMPRPACGEGCSLHIWVGYYNEINTRENNR